MLNDAIGWIGTAAFAACALPQAAKCVNDGNSDGLSWGFLLLWLIGELCTIVYVLNTSADVVLLVNYLGNLGFLIVMLWFKIYPRKG